MGSVYRIDMMSQPRSDYFFGFFHQPANDQIFPAFPQAERHSGFLQEIPDANNIGQVCRWKHCPLIPVQSMTDCSQNALKCLRPDPHPPLPDRPLNDLP